MHTLALGKNRGNLLRYAFEYVAFFAWRQSSSCA